MTENGQNVYEVIRNNDVWSRFVASDAKGAMKQAKKLKLAGEITISLRHERLQMDSGDITLEVEKLIAA